MLLDVEDFPYPAQSDLEALLDEGDYKAIRRDLAAEGIFMLASKAAAAGLLVRYALPDRFYQSSFASLTRTLSGVQIAGVRTTVAAERDLRELFQGYVDQIQPNHKNQPRITSVSAHEDGTIRLSVRYVRLNPRFAEFRRREWFSVEIEVSRSGAHVELKSFPKNSSDAMVVRDLSRYVLAHAGLPIDELNITRLSVEDRVKLFDALMQTGRPRWPLSTVCGLTIRAVEEEDSGDAPETEFDEEKLEVLNSAVLKGRDVRSHQIVSDLLDEGFYFSGALLWVQMPGSARCVKVKIDFKQKPRVLVVHALNEGEVTEHGYTLEPVSAERGRECVEHFWSEVHREYNRLMRASRAHARPVRRGSTVA